MSRGRRSESSLCVVNTYLLINNDVNFQELVPTLHASRVMGLQQCEAVAHTVLLSISYCLFK